MIGEGLQHGVNNEGGEGKRERGGKEENEEEGKGEREGIKRKEEEKEAGRWRIEGK